MSRASIIRRATSRVVGTSDTTTYQGDSRELIRWIGKPWRRVEFLSVRYYHRGGRIKGATVRIASLNLGCRGFALQVSLGHSPGYDYSEEIQ